SDGDGNLTLSDFLGDDMPKYATLSHRWEEGEVMFKDIIDGTSESKAGYGKIQFCGVQARRDGLEYFWVDTCCIDKSSSAELSEAINSMFRWYQKATRYYVYLSDVSIRKRKETNRSAECNWESAFRASKWFTRGWTLQELLALRSVEFFSRETNRLGDKGTLEQQIHDITGIPTKALRGDPLSQFDDDERFSWARSRETTRAEDKAYSLFGIFDVQMPLIYSEGKVKAFQRLRDAIDKPFKGKSYLYNYYLNVETSSEKDLLSLLPFATNAPFDSRDHEHEAACLPETRVDLLQEIHSWANGKDGQDEQCIFWLNGLAGTGKSTISRTIAHEYNEQKRLGASFFFSKGSGDAGHAGMFFTTLGAQLARTVPLLRQYICEAAKNQNDIASLSLSEQWRRLVLNPLSNLDSESCQTYIIVIDALDEYMDDNNIRIILRLLAEARSLTTVQLRIFLTSRPEIPVRYGIRAIPQAEHQDFVLHDIQPAIINYDISLFLEHYLRIIGQELFIWVSTACRFIKDSEEFAEDRLDEILEGTGFEGTPEQYLDQIYITVLQNSIPAAFRPSEKVRLYTIQRRILGSIVILFSYLPAASLAKVIGISGIRLTQTLERLQAILDVPKDVASLLRLHHPSFRDFLLSKDRCGNY
ncbi:Vegetative incompatibility protein HET-E-1, partial [Lachnellula suecica]